MVAIIMQATSTHVHTCSEQHQVNANRSTYIQVPRFLFGEKKNLGIQVAIKSTCSYFQRDALPIELSSSLGAKVVGWKGIQALVFGAHYNFSYETPMGDDTATSGTNCHA